MRRVEFRGGRTMDEEAARTASQEAPSQGGRGPAEPIFTIGHSTRSLAQFVALLQAHGVTLVADVRTVPRSRHNPQFNRETLPQALEVVSIGYVHLVGLGGWRAPRADSPNQGWRSPAFQGYADYMLTPEFEEHLVALIELARRARVALM